MISSPLNDTRLNVSTAMKPRTTDPFWAFGVIVSVIFPDLPAPSVNGV